MAAHGDAAARRLLNGPFRTGKIMPPMHPLQGLVKDRFYPVLHLHDGTAGAQRGQVVQLFAVNAVGTGADDKAFHQGVCEGRFEPLPENGQGSVGVGIGLEVGQISIGLPAPRRVEADAGLDLLGDAFPPGVPGMEGGVVAEGAPADAQRPVPVGAGETGVQREPLQAHKGHQRFVQPGEDGAEVRALGPFERGLDAFGCEDADHRAGILRDAPQVGVPGIGLLVSEGDIGRLDMDAPALQPVCESRIPEGAGDGSDPREQAGSGGGPDGEEAGEGYADEPSLGGDKAPFGLDTGDDFLFHSVQIGIGLPAKGLALFEDGGCRPGGEVVVPAYRRQQHGDNAIPLAYGVQPALHVIGLAFQRGDVADDAHFHSKLSFPAPVSKWYLTMPRSMLV